MVPSPATIPVTAPNALGLRISEPLRKHPHERAGRRRDVRYQHRHCGVAVRSERAAAVEAEPTDPQHSCPGYVNVMLCGGLT